MDFYKRKQTWKYVLFIIATIIATASLVFTNMLMSNLKKSNLSLSYELEEKMETWASAFNQLNNKTLDDAGDYSFFLEIIQNNTTIPTIVIDECNGVLLDKNLDKIEMYEDVKEREKYVLSELKIMRETGDSIPINLFNEQNTQHWLIYKNTKEFESTQDIIDNLILFPIFQIAFIFLFILLAYIIFNAARTSEQNQVWAGMAKETAHQIGTPVSSLMAWVELLKEMKGTEEMTQEMQKDLSRLETITERFSKIGSKPELKKENISEIIKETISYMGKRFSKSIDFEQNISIKSDKILLNKVLFIWVIENICKNAADAMKGEGMIKINCHENESTIEIYISDTGEGIDKNLLKSIFLPGITSKERGWGLGLSLAKRIIQDYHKGKIFVQNSSKNKGTTFCIILPK